MLGGTGDGGVSVGIDVGGTKIAAGLVSSEGMVLDRLRAETPQQADAGVELIVDMVRSLSARNNLSRVPLGLGVPGLVDLNGTVRYAPNLAWGEVPLRARLEEQLRMSVRIENDATAAVWAEYCIGAGHDAETSSLMLTIGTGVGGGLVIDRKLITGAHGFGAEFGHIVIAEGGPRCGCGNRGCLEALASGTAIARTARAALDDDALPTDSRLRTLEEVTGEAVTAAARAGDVGARKVLAEVGGWLGVGIASLVNALDPEVVIIGGGVVDAGQLLLVPAERTYHERVIARVHRAVPPVVRARLGNDAGLIGAALLGSEIAGA